MKLSEKLKAELEVLEKQRDDISQEIFEATKDIEDMRESERKSAEMYREKVWPLYDLISEKQFEVSREMNREIEVGDGVTFHLWSDAYACTVISRTDKRMVIQRDKATLSPDFKPEFVVGGFAGHCLNQEEQSYTYERDPNGEKYVCNWSEKHGCWRSGADASFRISRGRHEFYDYNF